MSKYVKIMQALLENGTKKTRTKTKSPLDTASNIDDLNNPQVNHPIAPTPEPEPQQQTPPPRPQGQHRFGGGGARGWTDEMSARLTNLINSDIPDDDISDAEARRNAGLYDEPDRIADQTLRLDAPTNPESEANIALWVDDDDDFQPDEPPTPENLPSIMSRAMAQTDDNIHVDWVPIPQLPGYVLNQIRKLGRLVFQPFTRTPLEDIVTVSEMAGNSKAEVRSLFRWIQQNAVKTDDLTIDFTPVFGPGYEPVVQLWKSDGYTFELVHEPSMGQYYVYAWPSSDDIPQPDSGLGAIDNEDPDITRLKRLS